MHKYANWEKIFIIFVLTLFCPMLFISCSQGDSVIVKQTKSYTIGEDQKTNVGNSMVVRDSGKFIQKKKYIGTGGYGDENWILTEERTGDSFKEELVYTGRSGDTIFVTYREYYSDLARPAFFQELRYDIGKSDIIVFKEYRIKILEATGEQIKFIILED